MVPGHNITQQFRTYKIIDRRYAGLYFSMCVDVTDNELAYLEAIHLFVEVLDRYFSNVCELDLVFFFHKVCGRCFLTSCYMSLRRHTSSWTSLLSVASCRRLQSRSSWIVWQN